MLGLILWFLQLAPDPGFRLSVTNIQQAKGSIYVAIYDREAHFLSLDKMHEQKIASVTNTGTMQLSFPNLPPGAWAISCFHDVNGNGKLDTNLLGVPTEPYGFSNNVRPKFRAPNWKEALFYVKNAGEMQSIRLEKW